METRVLIVFATRAEADILHQIKGFVPSADGYRFGRCDISILVTGVGAMATAWGMKQWLSNNPYPDLAVNAGIAGSYKGSIKIGDVVIAVSDCFADTGVESGETHMTLAEAGLMDPDMFPFEGGVIYARNKYTELAEKKFNKVNGITVNTCSGSEKTIQRLKNKFNPDIETMEGATFFYICAREKIPFLSVRAISNIVEPRNKDSWDISLAFKNLAEGIKELLIMLE